MVPDGGPEAKHRIAATHLRPGREGRDGAPGLRRVEPPMRGESYTPSTLP
jgi:hypothetical protein